MGQDKLALPWRGQRLIDGPATLLGGFCSELIALGRDYQLPGFMCLPDEGVAQGPFLAFLRGLEAMKGTHAILLAGDLKQPSLGIMEALQEQAVQSPHQVIGLKRGGHWEPLCSVYPKSQLGALRAQAEKGVTSFQKALGSSGVSVQSWDLTDKMWSRLDGANTPTDLVPPIAT